MDYDLYNTAFEQRPQSQAFANLPPTDAMSLQPSLTMLRSKDQPLSLHDAYGIPHNHPTTWKMLLSGFEEAQLDYQDPVVMQWAATHRQAFMRYHMVDVEKDEAPVFPAMFARLFWHMAFLDNSDFGRDPNHRYVFMTRQELISPNQDMRLALWPHVDSDLFLPGDKYAGRIVRAWNCYNRVPTFGYERNLAGEDITVIQNKVLQMIVGTEGEGAEERVYDYLRKIGAEFKMYGENLITGFYGKDNSRNIFTGQQNCGWLHMAQPLVDNCYLSSNSILGRIDFDKHLQGHYMKVGIPYVRITEPFLRNMVSLFVVEGPN